MIFNLEAGTGTSCGVGPLVTVHTWAAPRMESHGRSITRRIHYVKENEEINNAP